MWGHQRVSHTFAAYFDEARISRRLGWDDVWGCTDARSLERFPDIEAQSQVRIFHECGSLVLMARSMGRRTGAILRGCAADGVAVRRLSQEALRMEFPDLGSLPMAGGVEGLLERDRAGYLNPRRLVQAQLTLAPAGGQILRGVVTAVRKDRTAGLWRLRIDVAGECREIGARRVVVATGSFTNHNGVLPEECALTLHAFGEPNMLFEIGDDQLDRLRGLPSVVSVDPEDTGDTNMSLYLLSPVRYPDGRWYMRIGPGM